MIQDYFMIALGSLRRRRLRSWLTMLGIVIGITAVIALVGIGQGLKVAITSQFGDLGTDKLTITATGGFGPPGTSVINPLSKDNVDDFNRISGVKIAGGRLLRPGQIEFNDNRGYVYAVSMPDGEMRDLVEEVTGIEAEKGRMLKDGERGKIMLGGDLADTEFGGKKMAVGSKVAVQENFFEAVGILKREGSFILDSALFINEDDMREIFDIPEDDYDIIVLQVSEGADMQKIKESAEKILRRDRDVEKGEEDFTVQTPEALLDQVTSTLFAVQLFVYIIAGISIVVGGIGIMNTMFTSVLERTSEIGIMKSIGARNSMIFTLFFIESGLLGSVGGVIGVMIGAGLAFGMSAVGRMVLGVDLLRANISVWLVLGSVAGSFLLGSIFGIIPAMKAAKLSPVEALSKRK